MSEGNVVIGLREVYDAVIRLTATVDRLVDSDHSTREDLSELREIHKEDMINLRASIKDFFADHEHRLRSLERSRWPIASLSFIVSAGAFVLVLFKTLQGG